MTIANRYLLNDTRIKIIKNSRNLGLFHTRIVGEKEAEGEYILHVDSDDFIDLDACKILWDSIQKNKIDIVGFNIQTTQSSLQSPIQYKKVLENSWAIWSKTYSQRVIKKTNDFISQKLQVKKLNMGEDALKFFLILLFSDNYLGINQHLYFYENNPDSVTKNYKNSLKAYQNIQDLNTILQILESINDLNIFQAKQGYKEAYQYLFATLSIHKKEWQYIYFHSCAYQNNGFFTYPNSFLKSIHFANSSLVKLKAIIRIFAFFVTFGQIKL